jgi:hypothetical protein
MVLFRALGHHPGTSFEVTDVKHEVLIAHLISELEVSAPLNMCFL